MKKVSLLFTTAFITVSVLAQPALRQQKVYGGNNTDGLRSTCITQDGGILAGGYSTSDSSGNKKTDSKGLYDMWIIKQDSLGKKRWERSLGGNGDEVLVDLKATPDGGYILCGFSTSDISGEKTSPTKGGYDYWIVKVDALGKVVWDKSLGGRFDDLGESIDVTTDGGYIVAGVTRSPVSGNITEDTYGVSDIWMAKLDADGNIQWQKSLGGSNAEGYQPTFTDNTYGKNYRLAVCRQAPDGGYLMATFSNSPITGDKTQTVMGYSDYWIVKLDANGNKLWDKTIGGSGSDYMSDMITTQDGGFILAGYSNSPISGNKTANSKGFVDFWLVKCNNAGNIDWDKTIGGSGDDVPQSILQTSDGSYVIGGYSNSMISGDKTTARRGGRDYWVVKTDNTGNVLWDKTIGGEQDDFGLDLKQLSPDAYIISGESYAGATGNKTEVNYGGGDFWGVRLQEDNRSITSGRSGSTKETTAIPSATAFLAYPNPVTTVLHIQNSSKTTFILTDQSGKRMVTKTIEGSGDLDTANIPAGTYYLTNTTTGVTQKVIIIK